MGRNYVVRLCAPVSIRVRANSERAAKRAALRHAKGLRTLAGFEFEEDSRPQWLEAEGWRVDEEDFEPVYPAQGEATVNGETP